jgi:cytochrome o ubiquinol oxidase subunit III
MSSHSVENVDPSSVRLWDYDDHGHDFIGTRSLGFWLYMMSDAMIFAGLFAAHGVYVHAFAGGFTAKEVIHPLNALWPTLFIFTSVLIYGFGMVALKKGSRSGVINALLLSFILGAGFLFMEWREFSDLAAMGALPQVSGFLSDFWAIILTHAIHVFFGLLWMAVMIVQIAREGFTQNTVYRLINLKIFWHFQAVIWVCVFTFVYLMGGI